MTLRTSGTDQKFWPAITMNTRRHAGDNSGHGFCVWLRGFRSFLLRGIQKVRGEWSLIALCHNLLKLHKASWQGAAMGTCVPVAN